MTTGLTIDRLPLLAGAAAAVLFFAVPTILMFRRSGFDIERHAISMLSLGDGGWMMKAVFIISGVLTLLCARGLHAGLAQGWPGFAGALLIGGFGVGLVLAGFFDAPAGLGFPPGTPQDQAPVMTIGPILHSVAFMVAFSALITSCFAFALHAWHAQQTIWAVISLTVGIALPTLIGLGISMTIAPGIAFYWATMLGWLWLVATAAILPPSA
jgi:acyl-CoA synthetase (AMP-forming)/AMP-acid ligase II